MRQGSVCRGGISPVIFAIFQLVVGAGAACNDSRLMPLNRTIPLGIITGTTPEQQEKAIEYGLAQRHWAIVQKTAGRYVAQLNSRGYRVVVNVDYGEQGIAVTYVDSSELKYTRTEDGRELIHRRYTSWVKGLIDDIRYALRNGYSNPPPPSPPPVTVMEMEVHRQVRVGQRAGAGPGRATAAERFTSAGGG